MAALVLDPRRRRELRARAHHLRPLVSIGRHGVTPSVLREIELALAAHELVKIRVVDAERPEREILLERMCDALGAAPVQHLGKLLIVWRPAPEPRAAPAPPRKPAGDTRRPAKATRRRRRQT